MPNLKIVHIRQNRTEFLNSFIHIRHYFKEHQRKVPLILKA